MVLWYVEHVVKLLCLSADVGLGRDRHKLHAAGSQNRDGQISSEERLLSSRLLACTVAISPLPLAGTFGPLFGVPHCRFLSSASTPAHNVVLPRIFNRHGLRLHAGRVVQAVSVDIGVHWPCGTARAGERLLSRPAHGGRPNSSCSSYVSLFPCPPWKPFSSPL